MSRNLGNRADLPHKLRLRKLTAKVTRSWSTRVLNVLFLFNSVELWVVMVLPIGHWYISHVGANGTCREKISGTTERLLNCGVGSPNYPDRWVPLTTMRSHGCWDTWTSVKDLLRVRGSIGLIGDICQDPHSPSNLIHRRLSSLHSVL